MAASAERRDVEIGAPETVSPMMRAVLDAADRAASTAIPVLIEGESGVGKEWLARRLHERSPRRDRPFVAVNCGAIPAQLVESILFGHEKGAFTGATEKHRGKFIEADGGTLLLDEVGELPPEAQVKLLRVLQEGEVEPVGARGPRKVDVRVVSATNRTLLDEVVAGRFREDLYYRLGVFPLTVPPLRSRRGDIADLAAMFLRRVSTDQGIGPRALSPGAVAALEGRPWPGNIRELENVIFRAAVLCRDDVLTAADLQPETTSPAVRAITSRAVPPARVPLRSPDSPFGERSPLSADDASPPEGWLIPAIDASGELRTMDAVERDMIELALRRCDGRITESARRLGIGRSTLYRKLSEYGIVAASQARAAA